MIYRWLIAIPFVALAIVSTKPASKGVVVFLDESCEASLEATSADGFSAPDGIVWHQDQLYLADEGGTAIVQLGATERGIMAGVESGIASPEDLVIANDGSIYFTDDDAGGLWTIQHGCPKQLVTKEQGLASTEGLVIAPNGNILVGDGEKHTIFEVTREGGVSVLLGPDSGLDKPESLAFDHEGNLYIADNGKNVIFRRDRSGDLRPLLTAKDGLVQPESLCVVGNDLFITDDEAGKLYRYRPSSGLKTLAVFGGQLQSLQGVCKGPGKTLLISVQDLIRHRGLILRISIPWLDSQTQPKESAGNDRVSPVGRCTSLTRSNLTEETQIGRGCITSRDRGELNAS